MSDIIKSESESLYKESVDSNYETYRNSGYLVSDSSFLFAVNKRNTIEIIHGKLNQTSETLFSLVKDNYEKEKLYITAIKNLLKQKKYSNLIYELTNKLIDENEFSTELSENEDLYLIKVNDNLDSIEKIKTLITVIQNIDTDFNEEDLMEIFSINDSFVLKNLNIQHKIK